MTTTEPTESKNLGELYDLETLPWSRALSVLEDAPFAPSVAFVLGTVRPDGTPHASGIGAAWHDGAFYFKTGPDTGKGRHIAANPAVTMWGRLPGLDLTVEGDAERVTDTDTLAAIAKQYNDGGWPVEVEGDTFTAPYSAPSAGPPPWHLFRIVPRRAFGITTAEPYGATRWRWQTPAG